LRNLIKTFGKTSFVWFFSGLGVAVICTAIFFGPCKSSSIQPQPNLTSKQSPPKPKTLTSITLSAQAKAQAIAQIKHHALVSDADISVSNNQLQLALLVATNTPATYAERLGRQFTHYLKEQLKKNKQASQEMLVKVSVYYPGGTRIEVAINGQSGEEEVLPKRNDE
jgi:hypothetical protein